MRKALFGLTLLATAVMTNPRPAAAADDTIMVLVHFHPTPGREGRAEDAAGQAAGLRHYSSHWCDLQALSLADRSRRVPPP
jgi:hypothetical protein